MKMNGHDSVKQFILIHKKQSKVSLRCNFFFKGEFMAVMNLYYDIDLGRSSQIVPGKGKDLEKKGKQYR